MKIAILCQEEPVFLGPFLQGVIAARPDAITAVVIAGRRSAGERRGALRARVEALHIFWLVFEPRGFLEAAWRRLRFAALGARDPSSVERLARARGIPVHHVQARTSAGLQPIIEGLGADVVLNQSEILLKAELLRVPRIGFVNRHGSLLPSHRGRMGSFWAHAAGPPSYGVTIHMVDEGIDTGPVLARWEASDVDPAWPFPRVLRHLNRHAPALFWEAMNRLAEGGSPSPQPPGGPEPPHRFPTLAEARAYRAVMAVRRQRGG